MKRNMDLVREILLEVEAKDDGKAKQYDFKQLGPEKAHHVNLLIQAGLLNWVGAVRSQERKKVHLTWEGHDFLDSVRDVGIWEKTKETVAETGGSAAIEIIKAVAIGFAKKKIEQHTGIDI
ncbi:DUF2513 domain-containing protein [Pseudoruegeria sp. HB172150]|uniref:DUF2513 domain-containing protein n=1 Tax=Pseudoruegeria sp. HB172150 TaxID=2721164 RepID=UPI0015570859|nr:DUF2513 domain-containing protein [Pseudoruegeria sp. HB172150]